MTDYIYEEKCALHKLLLLLLLLLLLENYQHQQDLGMLCAEARSQRRVGEVNCNQKRQLFCGFLLTNLSLSPRGLNVRQ